MHVKEITVNEAKNRAEGGAFLVDVRTDAEYSEVHAQGAAHLPLDRLSREALLAIIPSPEAEVLFICKSGGRSRQACEKMAQVGFTNLVNVRGGTGAWLEAGLPSSSGAEK